jgi:predicted transcriptional regulator
MAAKQAKAACDHEEVNDYFFREWREAKGLSRGQLAKLMKLTTSAVSRVESGQRKWTQTYCEDFARVIGCHVYDPLMHRPGNTHGSVDTVISQADYEALRATVAGHIQRRVRQIGKAVGKTSKRTAKDGKKHR